MSEYISQIDATIVASIDIEDFGITDFNNLTDKQVLSLFNAMDVRTPDVFGCDELDITCDAFDTYDPQTGKCDSRYYELRDRHYELWQKRELDYEEKDRMNDLKKEQLAAEKKDELEKLEEKYGRKYRDLNKKMYIELEEKWGNPNGYVGSRY